MATFGLFRLASSVCPLMVERGEGTILVTSATAAMRGNAGQHSHAAAMAGRRMLCQSLNAEFAARGIHVAHIVVDGAVDAPDTLGKMLGPERFQKFREARGMEHDGAVAAGERSRILTCIWPGNIDPPGRSNSISGRSATSRGWNEGGVVE